MYKILLLLCSLLSIIQLQAQNTTIIGRVTDAATDEPLIAATVQVANTNIGTITDFDGNYSLSIPRGEYQIQIQFVGYTTQIISTSTVSNEQATLNVALEEQSSILQTATVTSGKFEKPLGEVTVSLEVLKPALIDNTAQTSLDGAIEKIPGVTVIDGQANIRGGSGFSQGAGSRVLLLQDDIPILQADAGYPNWDDVPIESIAQVEVVKGAASALYGSSALNGIVNVRTAFAKKEPETKIMTQYTHFMAPAVDSFKWWSAAPYQANIGLSHKRKIGKTDVVLGAFYNKLESFNQHTYNERGRININLKHRINDNLAIGLNSNFNKGQSGSFFYWKDDTHPYETRDTAVNNNKRLRFNIDPYLTYFDNNNNRHKLMTRFYSVDNDNSGNQSNTSQLYYGEYQFQRNFSNIDLVATTGVTAMGTHVNAALYGDTTMQSSNYAYYLQLDKKLFDKLSLSAGFRYEYNKLVNPGFSYKINGLEQEVAPLTDEESRPVIRFGANYHLAKATYLRASFGQGYRYPTIAEKYIFTNVGGFFITPNPELESETGWSAELAIKQGFKIKKFSGFIDLAAFTTRYQDMMEFNVQGFGFQAANIGDTRISGAEITIAGTGQINAIDLNILTGYTYINPLFDEFDPNYEGVPENTAQNNALNSSSNTNILKYRSRHSFKFDISAQYKKFTWGANLFYNSQFEAVDQFFVVFIAGVKTFRANNTKGFTRLDTRLSWQTTEHLKMTLLLNNITNELITTRPGLATAPRNLTFRVDYNF